MSAQLSFPSSLSPLRVVAERVADFVSIRGVRLLMDQLVDASFFTPEATQRLREQLFAATPFPHLVIEGLFNPALLELVREEFDGRVNPPYPPMVRLANIVFSATSEARTAELAEHRAILGHLGYEQEYENAFNEASGQLFTEASIEAAMNCDRAPIFGG